MSPDRLLADAKEAVASGGKYLVLTVPRKRAPSERAALLPGMIGKLVAYDGQRATIMIEASVVVRWFERRPTYPADYAAYVAERAANSGNAGALSTGGQKR